MTADAGSREAWNIVRSHDPDRYLSVLFAPKSVRDALMTLYAFHCEIARVPLIVSEPMLGEIRLQWWRDAIADASTPTGNPLADALNGVIARHGLSSALLTGAIDARSFDLDDRPMPDMQAMTVYLGKTEGIVFSMAAQILLGEPLRPEKAAREASLACGLTRLLLNLSRDHARGRQFLAADVFTDAGCNPDTLKGPPDNKVSTALVNFHDMARQALEEARLAIAGLPKAVLPAFLPLALVEPGLGASQRRADPFHDAARINPLVRHWRLWRAMLRGRV